MKNKLVIFYSLSGNTKFIAEVIAKAVDADILELKTKCELIKKDGFMKYFWGGKRVMMKEKPKLIPLEKNPADYDIIFIGTPVWAWNYTPPLRSFFSQVKLNGKKIALFCTHGGQKGKTFENMKMEIKNNEFIGEIDFFEPLKNNKKEECVKKVKQWADVINKKFIF